MSPEEKEAVLNRHNSGARRLALLKAVASLARSLSLPLSLSLSLARSLAHSPSRILHVCMHVPLEIFKVSLSFSDEYAYLRVDVCVFAYS